MNEKLQSKVNLLKYWNCWKFGKFWMYRGKLTLSNQRRGVHFYLQRQKLCPPVIWLFFFSPVCVVQSNLIGCNILETVWLKSHDFSKNERLFGHISFSINHVLRLQTETYSNGHFFSDSKLMDMHFHLQSYSFQFVHFSFKITVHALSAGHLSPGKFYISWFSLVW